DECSSAVTRSSAHNALWRDQLVLPAKKGAQGMIGKRKLRYDAIDEAIRLRDKVLLILSEAAIASDRVYAEGWARLRRGNHATTDFGGGCVVLHGDWRRRRLQVKGSVRRKQTLLPGTDRAQHQPQSSRSPWNHPLPIGDRPGQMGRRNHVPRHYERLLPR